MAPAALPESESVVDFVVNEGRGVKGLSDMGIKTLPRHYIQPPKERIVTNSIVIDDSIPIIDISGGWDDPAVARAVCEAAEEWGFFQITNHGVPVELLESLKAATYRFFKMPAEEKRKYSKANSPSENVRYGTSFSPESEKTLEWKDYLSLFYVSDDEAEVLWPPACRHEALEYMTQCNAMIKNLLEMLMRGLNIDNFDETKEPLFMGSKRINFNYYPKCPDPELAVGVGRHSDISTITVLLQDNIGGLQVRNPDTDTWVHVPPVNGALVINIGDALQILSNGRYKSAEHRVSANGNNDRISVPIFVTPDPGCRVGPLPEVLGNGEKPIYRELVYADYLRHFFGKGHDGKETIEFAKI